MNVIKICNIIQCAYMMKQCCTRNETFMKLNACITRHQSAVMEAETVSKILEIHSILITLEAIITDTVLLMISVTGDFKINIYEQCIITKNAFVNPGVHLSVFVVCIFIYTFMCYFHILCTRIVLVFAVTEGCQ
jgi:hypothetical protein